MSTILEKWSRQVREENITDCFDIAFLYGEAVLKCKMCEWVEIVLEDEFLHLTVLIDRAGDHYYDSHYCDGCVHNCPHDGCAAMN
jgi:hypothetical protein